MKQILFAFALTLFAFVDSAAARPAPPPCVGGACAKVGPFGGARVYAPPGGHATIVRFGWFTGLRVVHVQGR